MKSPEVSVLLPVRNGAVHLRKCLESVATQSGIDFEVILVDDGSSDKTSEIAREFAALPLMIIRNGGSQGVAASLNRAIEASRGEFLARMDADDLMESGRLMIQAEYLKKKPEIGILGSRVGKMDEAGNSLGVSSEPLGHSTISLRVAVSNPFVHPSVMLRKSVLEKYGFRYREDFAFAQDYELWSRMIRVCRGENLSDPLIRYRKGAGVGAQNRERQLEFHGHVIRGYARTVMGGDYFSEAEVGWLMNFWLGSNPPDQAGDVLLRYGRLLKKLALESSDAESLRYLRSQCLQASARSGSWLKGFGFARELGRALW